MMDRSRMFAPAMRALKASRKTIVRPRIQQWRWRSSGGPLGTTQEQHFWTTSRVLLFSAFTASLTYLYGIQDHSSHVQNQIGSLPKASYAKKAELEKAVSEVRGMLGEDAISTDDEDLHRHGYSEWSSINIDTLPVAVAYPKSTEEVSQIAKVCHKYHIPIIPYSGGSSLEANFAAPFGGVSVDFTFMDKVLELRPDGKFALEMTGAECCKLTLDGRHGRHTATRSRLDVPERADQAHWPLLPSRSWTERHDRRHGRNLMLWHECSPLRDDEGLGNQPHGGVG
jgi:hypothetical protein